MDMSLLNLVLLASNHENKIEFCMSLLNWILVSNQELAHVSAELDWMDLRTIATKIWFLSLLNSILDSTQELVRSSAKFYSSFKPQVLTYKPNNYN